MNYRTSSDTAWHAFRSIYWTFAGAMALALVLLAVLGFGPGGRNCKAVATAAGADGTATVAVAQQPAEHFACRMAGSTARPGA
jgi:hypothetical protein